MMMTIITANTDMRQIKLITPTLGNPNVSNVKAI